MLKEHLSRGSGKNGRVREWKKNYERLFSRYNMVSACANSLPLRLLAQDLHKISPVKISACILAVCRHSEDPHLAEKILTVDSY